MPNIRILSAEQTKSLLTLDKVIAAVGGVYTDKAKGETSVFPLVFHEFEEGVADMDIKSGHVRGAGIFGLKLVSWFSENESKNLPALSGTVLVCDDSTGLPLGILDGGYITGIRTGVAGALGAKYLAREDSKVLLMVGAGHSAAFLLAAAVKMLPSLEKVIIHSPRNPENARKLIDKLPAFMQSELGECFPENIQLLCSENLQESAQIADIIFTATPSKSPLVQSAWVKPGTHFSCIGADMSGKQEIDGDIVAQARLFVDDALQCCNVGEIELPIKNGVISPKHIVGELGHVMNETVQGRQNAQQITVFDATGTALLDLAVAKYALDGAAEQNVGTVVKL